MSDDAKTLMYWISNAGSRVADNAAEAAYCYACAFRWAMHIISRGC